MTLDGLIKPVVHLIFHVVVITVWSSKRIFSTSVMTAMQSSAWRKQVVVCVQYPGQAQNTSMSQS